MSSTATTPPPEREPKPSVTPLGCVANYFSRLFEQRRSSSIVTSNFQEDRQITRETINDGANDDDDDDGVDEEETFFNDTADHGTRNEREDGDASRRRVGELKDFLVWHIGRIALWEDPRDTVVHLLAFNVIFWGTVLFHLRGVTAVCSAVMVFGISSVVVMEPHSKCIRRAQFTLKYNRFEKDVEYVAKELQLMIEELNRECPTMFFLLVLIIFVFSALVIPYVNPICLVYVLFMSLFVVPPVFVWFFGCQLSSTEKDGEITEFLPEVTEDSLQVLNRAGETGDSPTPSNSANDNSTTDKLDEEEELEGIKMPSHEEAAEDSEEDDDLSDIEIQSYDDTDAAFKKHWHANDDDDEDDSSSASSDDDNYNDDVDPRKYRKFIASSLFEIEEPKKSKKLDKNSKHLDVDRDSNNSSDDDFEIIDDHELEELKNV